MNEKENENGIEIEIETVIVIGIVETGTIIEKGIEITTGVVHVPSMKMKEGIGMAVAEGTTKPSLHDKDRNRSPEEVLGQGMVRNKSPDINLPNSWEVMLLERRVPMTSKTGNQTPSRQHIGISKRTTLALLHREWLGRVVNSGRHRHRNTHNHRGLGARPRDRFPLNALASRVNTRI